MKKVLILGVGNFGYSWVIDILPNGSYDMEFSGDNSSRIAMLREAVTALESGRKGETDISDNLYSYLWMEHAIKSSEEDRAVNFSAKFIYEKKEYF